MPASTSDVPGPLVRVALPDRLALDDFAAEAMAVPFVQADKSVHVEPNGMEVLLTLAAEPDMAVRTRTRFLLCRPRSAPLCPALS